MCRLFAFRSNFPVSAQPSISGPGNSLVAQSCRDACGESHADGWGLASFDDNCHPHITKSLASASSDLRFNELAKSVTTTTLLAHVRQASVGSTSLVNTHPFVHDRWIFAHNGTLQNFAARKQLLLDAIPDDLRQLIRGDTDSEQVFMLWLAHLRSLTGSLDTVVDVVTIIDAFQQTIKLLDAWFPTHNAEESTFNFVATDGRLLAATRWGRPLSCRERRSNAIPGESDRPLPLTEKFRAVDIASEPTDGDGWRDVPDHSVVVVDQNLAVHTASHIQHAVPSRDTR
jgi:predicted glutamine amidotransferase